MFRGLQDKINQILQSFEEMKSSGTARAQGTFSNSDPSSQCKLLAEEMKRVSEKMHFYFAWELF